MTSLGLFRNLTTYGDQGFSRYLRRSFLASAGFSKDDFERPVVGIVDTRSDYNTCHREFPQLVDAVRRGVSEAGGIPMVFPTISLGEVYLSPTSMLFRNLMALETEEMIRAQPMDAVVLLGGCDKTVPAQLMAAASVDIPTILVVAGPMRTGSWRGERLGACTDCRHYWARFRAGTLSEDEIDEVERSLAPTAGTCMVMGTASTMACMAETLGLMLPGGAAAPAVSGDRLRTAVESGRRAVALAAEDLRPHRILTRSAFMNALVVLMAIGGSTNAIVHLIAVARRAGVELSLDDFDKASSDAPLLVDCKPSGTRYLEDFHDAGGVPMLLKVLAPLLDLSTTTVTGRTLEEELQSVRTPGRWQDVIRTLEEPLGPNGSLAILRGSLAPEGAVIKKSAATPRLLRHTGPALVFDSPEQAYSRLEDPTLEVSPDHVLILRNAGPVGAGMPESASLPIPRKLAANGVTDMVRISDGRMSGTSYGTVVLHCSPESAVGGPLAIVANGDLVKLDVEARRVDLLIADSELARRQSEVTLPSLPTRGWRRLYAEHVLPAHLGADMDFLTAP
jgi:dihydroxy-acid dehydratase